MKKAIQNFLVNEGYAYYTPSGSFVFKNLNQEKKWDMEEMLYNHGIQLRFVEKKLYEIANEEKATLFMLEWG